MGSAPGYYRDDAFGIRCENLAVVRSVEDAGLERPMLSFEALTLVPFDRRLIDTALLGEAELAWIDGYHARVAREILPLLEGAAERAWLEAATAPLAGAGR